MPRKKRKDLDVQIDTPNVDVSVIRKDGETHLELDTKVIDVEFDSTKEKGKKLKVTVDAGETLKKLSNIITRVICKKRG